MCEETIDNVYGENTVDDALTGWLNLREWTNRQGQNREGGKCRSGHSGTMWQGWTMREWKYRHHVVGVDSNCTFQILCSSFGFDSIIQLIFVRINICTAFRNRIVVSRTCLHRACLTSERRVGVHAVLYTENFYQKSRMLGLSTHQCIFTARCYASAVLAMALCLSVRLCLSQVGVLLKRQNVGSHKQHHTIPQGV